MSEKRLIDLETKLAHLEDTVRQLDKALCDQQDQIGCQYPSHVPVPPPRIPAPPRGSGADGFDPGLPAVGNGPGALKCAFKT